MKTITLTIYGLFLFTGTLLSQTFTTGTINLSNTSGLEYSAKIDITASEVTLTLIGPADRYIALGFGVDSMTEENDVVMYLNGATLSDRTFDGVGNEPLADSNQDWSTVSNTVSSGVRTIVSTRALNTGEPFDYIFSPSQTSIDLVWARANSASFALNYHGDNRGITSAGITLGVDEFQALSNFRVYPNPVTSEFNLILPNAIETANIEVYNVLGKRIASKDISNFNSKIEASNWSSGVYLVKVSAGKDSQTKRIIKQ